MYEYKMVQIPPNISVQMKKHKGNEAAAYLESVVNKYASQGWEFYRTDSIGVSLKPGNKIKDTHKSCCKLSLN